ncbi:hypothetical protein Dip518_000828 [Parelusimicrobium proximum]|uniref:SIMPL domain-containing protein n=1 Tax=Parelusimicrobium proximum TaxID=3228953 RepID=UPI003D16A2FC
MKKYLAVLAASAMLCGISVNMQAKEEKEIFRVSADAEVRIKPNRVAITFGVSEKTESLQKGKDSMKKVISQSLDFCRKNGVKDKFIQTENIYISPTYETKYIYNKVTGKEEREERLMYNLSQTFTVTLEDLSKYDALLYGLLDKGVNRVESITFYSTEMRKYRDDARLLAVKHAKDKADLLTKAAGIKLGKVKNISEDNYSSIYWGGMKRGMSNMSQNMTQNYDGGEESSDLAAGMISVKAAVTLSYEID